MKIIIELNKYSQCVIFFCFLFVFFQIFEGVKNEDPFIRNEAVKCLGHLSLLSKSFAAQHLVLFLQVKSFDSIFIN